MRRLAELLAGLCLLALVVALCGCGSSGGPAGPGENSTGKPQPPSPPPPPDLPGKLVGSKVVNWQTNTWAMYVMEPDGANKTQVPLEGSALAHCWSRAVPDLICCSRPYVDRQLWTVLAGGGTPAPFTVENEPGLPGPGQASAADWSTEDQRVAFQWYWVDEEYYNLHAIAVKGWPNGEARLITPGQRSVRDEFPTWSPDGQHLLFSRFSATPAVRKGLMVVSADGGSPSYVSDDPSVAGTSDWHQDATTGRNWIVYAYASGSTGLAMLEVDATGHALGTPIPLPGGGYSSYYRCPCWSPDGRFVAFSNESFTKKGPLYTTYILDVASEALYKVGDLGFVDWAAQ